MVAMLGDLKGVKFLIEQNNIDVLIQRVTVINEIFAKAFLKEKKRSRSLHCYSFSDSILAIWKSNKEGKDYAKSFSLNLWQQIQKHNFPYRIFIDGGLEFNDTDNIGNIISSDDVRFKKLFPVSISIWSIFLAESSKFPEGVFIGTELNDNSKTQESDIFKAGNFSYCKLT